MAIATLELCFQNPAVFDRNVKISRGSVCQSCSSRRGSSTSLRSVQAVCEEDPTEEQPQRPPLPRYQQNLRQD
ncbi:hypothetical protein ACJ73_03104 [Blastomyces percursus]|uniref:Uncharacterized protein n=1 Tax=Blastomyces percursus TaxID=1658174 RepID=A0A1J9RCY3_9EURO|nr:hypothetical protein ACJ73_03104 [Blastomyces percursus]